MNFNVVIIINSQISDNEYCASKTVFEDFFLTPDVFESENGTLEFAPKFLRSLPVSCLHGPLFSCPLTVAKTLVGGQRN